MRRPVLYLFVALALSGLLSGCQVLGMIIGANAGQTIQDCIPHSVTRPCD